MPVYDQEKTEDLNALTGVSKAEEKAIDARANDSPGSLRPDQLASAERSANNPSASPASQAESQTFGSAGGGGNFGEAKDGNKGSLSDGVSDKIGKGFTYKNSKGKRRFRLSRAQGGGVVTGLLAAGTLGVMGVLSGPLQLIHISQLLTGLHFSPMESFTDDRNSRLGRYVRHVSRGNGVEKIRMGVLGNKIADRIESRMNQNGLQSAYGERFGFQEGFRLVPGDLAEGSSLKDIDVTNEDLARQQVADQYGISADKIRIVDGVVQVGFEGNQLNNRELRGVQSKLLNDAGYSKIGSAMRSRIMFRRGGVSLHPLKRLDRKVIQKFEERIKKFNDDRDERIKNGADPPNAQTRPTDFDPGSSDEEGNVIEDPHYEDIDEVESPDTSETTQQGQDVLSADGDTPSARRASLKAKFGSVGVGFVGIAGMVCAIHSLNAQVDDIRFANVTLPLMRLGGEAIAVGSQLQAGQDVDPEQVNELLKKTYDPETQKSWSSAKSIQAELGQKTTGEDVGDEVTFREGRHPIQQIADRIPTNDSVCKVVENGVFQVVATVASFATGPFATIAGEIVSQTIISPLAESFVNFLAGDEIVANAAFGPVWGNFINYGARLAAKDNAIAGGGTPLTKAQAGAIDAELYDTKQEETKYASVYDRYFNVYKYDSAASSFLMNPNIAYGNGLVSMVQNPLSSFSNFGSLFSSLFSPASAQQPLPEVREGAYDYGFDEYGFSLEDREHPDVANPYENGDVMYQLLQDDDVRENINVATQDCFAIHLTKDGDYEVVSQTGEGEPQPVNTAKITVNCLNPEGISDDNWRRIRFYIHDVQTLTGMACYESIDENDCTKIGFDSSSQPNNTTQSGVASLTDLGQPSDNIACAVGTKDVGVHDGYFQGSIVRIKLCAIPNFPSTSDESSPGTGYYVEGADGNVLVNSRISSQVLAMFNAAKSDTLSLKATSSFRTMEHQQDLCRRDDKCPGGVYTDVARPGTSNHQLGVAIDFDLGPGFSNSVNFYSPEGGGTPGPDNPRITPARESEVWSWLDGNASNYGMEPYWNEPWHWSPFGG